MPRRKKLFWKPNIKAESLESVIALVFIMLGFLTIIAQSGSLIGVENFLFDFWWYLFGVGSFFLSLLFVVLGLNLTKIKHAIAQPRPLWGLLLGMLGFSALIGSIKADLGGYVGINLVGYLSAYITRGGTFIIGLTILVISILVTFNLSIREVSKFFSPLMKFLLQLKDIFSKKPVEQTPESTQTPPAEPQYIMSNRGKTEETESVIEIIEENKPTLPPRPVETNPKTPAVGSDSDSEDIQDYPPYAKPPITLLDEPQQTVTDQSAIERNARTIEATLSNFGIQARIAEVNLGPAVTQYAINLAEGTRSSKILSLQNDIALALASPTGSVRVESPIPGKRFIGIEVPNGSLSVVRLKSIIKSPIMVNDPSPLTVALGEDVSGQPSIAHVEKWPHILIAGSTGSGKSVLIHSIINSILFRATPEQVRFIMVDPKRVELTQYNSIPHLQTPVIVDVDKTVHAFKWAVEEMEKRYRLFQQIGARNLADFNQHTDTEQLPYIVIIVDELADLMIFAANEMETLITRIAQKARATGIFMILSTQRPSVDVITGLIKANIPTRIALNVSSSTDSRVILDMIGAEKLLGKGDMLYLPPDAGKPKRIQGIFMSNQEITRITDYMMQFRPGYADPRTPQVITSAASPASHQTAEDPGFELQGVQSDDNKFIDAVKVILNHDKASASLLQRRLKIGYARAARILDELQEKGLVGPQDGSNPREVFTEAAIAYVQKLGLEVETQETTY